MTRWIWVHLVVATLIAVSWLVLGTLGQAYPRLPQDDNRTGICQRKYIRNEPASLESLRGCKVIEGSLQIAVAHADSPSKWLEYSFPDLREITGYLLLFDVSNLTTMRKLLPNLAVIRGQELIDTHALVINTGNELQEIGLPSLTDVQRGTVYIVDNGQLCYVDTIDWGLITNESSGEEMRAKNKPSEQCPNTCQSKCPKSGGRSLCWGNQDCQTVFTQKCPHCRDGRPCTERGECCSDQCLGGCFVGTSPRACHVCKHVLFNETCTEECPSGFYEYLQRRCVTREECLRIVAAPDVSKTQGSSSPLHGKIFEPPGEKNKKMCVLDCPKDTELAPNKTACVSCKGACKKDCPGTLVDSIEKARELAGCTRITGILKISIRRSSAVTSGNIIKELKENLDKIEEIDDHLVITHTHAIVSLDFLENLKVIRGVVLEDGRYALVVRNNENLMELWGSRSRSRRILIENKDGRVLFHYNPKLCQQKIWDFVSQSGIKHPKDDKIEIGITNGDKATCNTRILEVEIEKKTNNSVLIRYENFRRNLTLTSHLLNYEIHYKEAPDYPKKNVTKYENRDPCGDDDWTILEYPKISDAEVRGGIQNEPVWEHTRLIVNLKHYAWYALYVKTIVIPDVNSLNNNTGAESDIIYFQTLPGVPSTPQEFKLASEGPNSVTVTWTPPMHPNGELKEFHIYLKVEKEDQSVQDQRDYCKDGRTMAKVTSSTIGRSTVAPFLAHPTGDGDVTLSVKANDSDCCSCSAVGGKTTPPSHEAIHYQTDMMHQIMNHVFIPQSDTSSVDVSQDMDNNNIRLRKRSIRSIEDSSDNSGEKMSDIVFPGVENTAGSDQPRVPKGMEEVENGTIPVDSTGNGKYTFNLKNLTHFTTYMIGVQACRTESNSTEIENDTRTCSDFVTERVQTAPSLTSDNIDPKSIHINVTEGRPLQLSWTEPTNPNGVVLGYWVRVQRWDGSAKYPDKRCVTRKDFTSNRNNYTFQSTLQPGNYSVSIQVASLARDSDWTVDKYFLIEDTDRGLGTLWAVVVIIPLLMLTIAGSFLAYYYMRKKDSQIFSPNPEYMSNVEIPEEWEVPRDKLTLLQNKVLGQGSFGKVVEGILRDFVSGCPAIACAVKTVSEDTPGEYRVLFLREAALMVKLDCHCHHVVKLLGVISKTQPTYVIMELMTNGDLKNYLRSRRRENSPGVPPPTLRQVLRMAAEIADGMLYIHKHKLVHRDLAARNCMVSEELVVKVGDFGMTKEVIQSDYYRKQTKGLLPVRWMAPESLRDGVFTSQSDMWSFGVVLWEMATLAYQPYQGLSNGQVLEYVLSGRTMERPENCPDILFDLMTWCWQVEARHRPTFIQILDRLGPDLDPSFAQASFFNSTEGQYFREELENKEDQFIGIIDVLTPLATLDDDDDDLDDYDSDDDGYGLNHHIVDDLGDTPSRLLLSSPPTTATITGSSRNVSSSLTNGLALNPLVINPSPRTDFSANAESVNLANHALPAPTPTSTYPYSVSRTGGSNNYSPRPRTNSNNNNTNPRLPVSQNIQNNLTSSNLNRGGVGGGSAATTGSSSSISSSNFTSNIPNGIDSLVPIPFHHPTASTAGSPKCSLTNKSGDSTKVEQSKANALNSDCSDNSQALLINYSSDRSNSKISNGNSGNNSGGNNGYIIRRGSPISENQPVNRTTQC